jgi:hypothetical protein
MRNLCGLSANSASKLLLQRHDKTIYSCNVGLCSMKRELACCFALALSLALGTDAPASVYSHETCAELRGLASERKPYALIAERPIKEPKPPVTEPPVDAPPPDQIPAPVIIDGKPVPIPDNRTPGPTEEPPSEPPVDMPDLAQAEAPEPPPDEPSQGPPPDGQGGE